MAQAVLTELETALNSKRAAIRRNAADTLRYVGIAAPETATWLIRGLRDEDWAVRYYAADALGKREIPPREEEQNLLAALIQNDTYRRGNIINALGVVGGGESGEALRRRLPSEEGMLRYFTAFALAKIPYGRGQVEARAVLFELIEHEEAWLSREAGLLLFSLPLSVTAEARAKFLESRVARLAEDDAGRRAEAIYDIGMLGPGAEPVLRSIIDYLSDEDRYVRHYTAMALKRIGSEEARNVLKSHWRQSSAELLKSLEQEDTDVRRAIMRALGALGVHTSAVEGVLQENLLHADPGVRYHAMDALQQIGAPASAMEEELCEGLSNDDVVSRGNAVNALAAMRSARAVPALRMLLTDPVEEIRYLAALALQRFEGDHDAGEQVLRVLAGALEFPGRWYHDIALKTLVAMSGDESAPTKLLLEALNKYLNEQRLLLRNHDLRTRREAVRILSSMGQGALPALADLIVALDDRDPVVSGYAAEALQKIGHPDGLEAFEKRAKRLVKELTERLSSETSEQRLNAAVALGRIGKAALGAVPILQEMLVSEQRTERRSAARALGGIAAPESIPALIAALEDPDWGVRMNAAYALAEIGAPASEAVDALLEAVTGPDIHLQLLLTTPLRWLTE